MINTLLELCYVLCGIMMIHTGIESIKDKQNPERLGTFSFWIIIGIIFIGGNNIPHEVTGLLIIVIAILSLLKKVRIGGLKDSCEKFRRSAADRIGNKIFIPVLILAFVAFLIAQFTPLGGLIGIGISSIAALICAKYITNSPYRHIADDSDRLLQQIGPPTILPQILAALGILFTTAGVGDVISKELAAIIPQNSIFLGVVAYCVGMFIFSIIMGNSFAAFAVITAGIGLPFVIMKGANPTIAGALALTAGYCGTLITPMAANFNIVPAALLETKNKNIVILAQVPAALVMLVAHILLMYYWAF